jgi:putative tryptophan/tyrosine transport system substrate-binding protein
VISSLRSTLGDAERTRKYAAELLALSPDVILAIGTETTAALQHVTRTVPIIFVLVPDPVGAGIVDSLSRPGGNATGFTPSEYAIGGKMLELLKEIAPRVKRAGIIRDSASPSGPAQFGAIQAVAPSVGIEVSPIGIRDAGDIDQAIAAFARSSSEGHHCDCLHYLLRLLTVAIGTRLPSQHQSHVRSRRKLTPHPRRICWPIDKTLLRVC